MYASGSVIKLTELDHSTQDRFFNKKPIMMIYFRCDLIWRLSGYLAKIGLLNSFSKLDLSSLNPSLSR